MSGLPPQKLKELKLFIDTLRANPQLLHLKELDFFKDFMLHFGATLPEHTKTEHPAPKFHKKEEPKPATEESTGIKQDQQAEQTEEIQEPDDGLYSEDTDSALEIGDPNAEVADDAMEKASTKRQEAIQAQQEGNSQQAIQLLTEAIKLNPRGGVLYATRAQLLLNMKKPNAAIRDCDAAIKINPDSAKAYKVRGKAHRRLGHYEQALKDVQVGQKLDFDPDSVELEKFLCPRVEKIVAKRKIREEREHKERSKGYQTHETDKSESDFPNFDGTPGGEGMGVPPEFMNNLFSDPELMAALQNPAMMQKLNEIMTDPSAIEKYKDDPVVAKLLQKFGGMPQNQ